MKTSKLIDAQAAALLLPEVGRMVHFSAVRAHGGPPKVMPLAAIITAVNDPTSPSSRVTLYVMEPNGLTNAPQDIPFSEKPALGHWSWLPSVQRSLELRKQAREALEEFDKSHPFAALSNKPV